MKDYSHTQRAGRWLWIPAVACLFLVGLAVWTRIWAVLGSLAVLAGLAWLFSSLTVEVGGGRLSWRFGPGWLKKQVPLGDIVAARPVQTSWTEGWGIHDTRFGWLYNIAGCEAVAFELRNGKRFAVGSDEPDRLLSALQPHAV
jgi:hypothetical protein